MTIWHLHSFRVTLWSTEAQTSFAGSIQTTIADVNWWLDVTSERFISFTWMPQCRLLRGSRQLIKFAIGSWYWYLIAINAQSIHYLSRELVEDIDIFSRQERPCKQVNVINCFDCKPPCFLEQTPHKAADLSLENLPSRRPRHRTLCATQYGWSIQQRLAVSMQNADERFHFFCLSPIQMQTTPNFDLLKFGLNWKKSPYMYM